GRVRGIPRPRVEPADRLHRHALGPDQHARVYFEPLTVPPRPTGAIRNRLQDRGFPMSDPRRTDCEGFFRRDFLKLGSAGLLGLTLPDLLRLEAFCPDAAPRPK